MTDRDDFSGKTKLDLAMRAGFKCSFPTCRATTVGPSDEGPTKHSDVGVACHITAAAEGGRQRPDHAMARLTNAPAGRRARGRTRPRWRARRARRTRTRSR